MRRKSVAVVVVNWNSGKHLRTCIECLCKQSVKPARVIVVDNGSTDESLELLPKVENLSIRRMGENYGFGEANNRAIYECDNDYIALLNPDAFPANDWLEKLLEAAELNPDVAAFGSRQIVFQTTGLLDGVGDECHISGLVWRKKYLQRQSEDDLQIREIFSPCAAAALYRMTTLKLVGGFDADYFCYIEDVDLGFRLRLAGYRCLYIPDAVVEHVGSAASGRGSDFYVYHGQRNLVWNYIKNMPGQLFWLFLPLHIILNLFAIVLFTFRGQGRIVFKAKADALKAIKLVWNKRKIIQKHRVASLNDIYTILNKSFIPPRLKKTVRK